MCLALFQSAKSIFFGRTKSKPIEWIIENKIMKVIVVLYCNWIFQKLIPSLWPYLCIYFFGYDNCSSRDLLWAEKSPDDQDFFVSRKSLQWGMIYLVHERCVQLHFFATWFNIFGNKSIIIKHWHGSDAIVHNFQNFHIMTYIYHVSKYFLLLI